MVTKGYRKIVTRDYRNVETKFAEILLQVRVTDILRNRFSLPCILHRDCSLCRKIVCHSCIQQHHHLHHHLQHRCTKIWVPLLYVKCLAPTCGRTSTKFVHSCVIQTKSNKFKQSLTKSNKVEKYLESIKVP